VSRQSTRQVDASAIQALAVGSNGDEYCGIAVLDDTHRRRPWS